MASSSQGQLKQEVIKTYNAINQDMYVTGVSQQRVEILGDKMVILAEHRRIPALGLLDDLEPTVAQLVDMILVRENKRRLANALGSVVGLKVRTVLKDYDPVSRLAATVIVFEHAIDGAEKPSGPPSL